ncbi:hypothetical protein [Azospirillum thermophilum]|uniref:Uncharacterized protein n=1 Tax=Azospirillum thermophilum TaxID=2202148 RepID=A0A2S2CMI1_9PROT|nr:hypothetical protein [Azospirillum thermophilum]AWK85517.1 hypothetical protein DEW08_04465 [Azospirillum thermophilum]
MSNDPSNSRDERPIPLDIQDTRDAPGVDEEKMGFQRIIGPGADTPADEDMPGQAVGRDADGMPQPGNPRDHEGSGIDPTADGGPATPAIGRDGAQAGGGPHVGGTEGGTHGVLDLGTSATAGSTRGSDDRDRPQPTPDTSDRIIDDRNVSVDGGRDRA